MPNSDTPSPASERFPSFGNDVGDVTDIKDIGDEGAAGDLPGEGDAAADTSADTGWRVDALPPVLPRSLIESPVAPSGAATRPTSHAAAAQGGHDVEAEIAGVLTRKRRRARGQVFDRAVLAAVVLVMLAAAAQMGAKLAAVQQQQREALSNIDAVPPLVDVAVLEARRHPLRLLAQGRTQALDERMLSFESPGRIEWIVREGDEVAPGAEIARLVRAPFDNACAQAEANVASAHAAADQAQQRVDRLERLAEMDSGRAADLDDARLGRDAALPLVDAAQAALDEAERLRTASTLRSPHAEVAALALTTLTKAGEQVLPGRPVVMLSVQQPLKLAVEVTEDDYFLLLTQRDPGPQPAGNGAGHPRNNGGETGAIRCTVEFGPAAGVATSEGIGEYPAQLTRITRRANPATLRFPLELEVDNASGVLVSGLFVTVALELGEQDAEIRIPRAVATRSFGDLFVPVIDRDAQPAEASDSPGSIGAAGPSDDGAERTYVVRFVRIEASAAPDDPTSLRVTSGLAAGDWVVTSPMQGMRDGDAVRLRPPS